jgi:acylphosphatase
MMKRIEAMVYGRVQGVSFRYNTQRAAVERQLVGWVANQHNGSVKVVAEGSESNLNGLVDFLHQGIPPAHVDRVAVQWTNPTGEFSRFTIRWM